MAHHVQKKATKKHQATRPRKSRPSDMNRKPPQYPQIPEQPWMTVTESAPSRSTVSITVSPTDTADSLKAKLTAAGASAEEIFYQNQAVTGTFADVGLEAETTVDAVVLSP